jgi:hypothetical protein
MYSHFFDFSIFYINSHELLIFHWSISIRGVFVIPPFAIYIAMLVCLIGTSFVAINFSCINMSIK